MRQQLFIVCPFSGMEPFIRERFGQQALILTSMAAIYPLREPAAARALRDVLMQENVGELIVVNDTDCRFIHSALQRAPLCHTRAEQALRQIVTEHYLEVKAEKVFGSRYFTGVKAVQSAVAQEGEAQRLATLNVRRQIDDLLAQKWFRQLIGRQQIVMRGLVTNKRLNKMETVSAFELDSISR